MTYVLVVCLCASTSTIICLLREISLAYFKAFYPVVPFFTYQCISSCVRVCPLSVYFVYECMCLMIQQHNRRLPPTTSVFVWYCFFLPRAGDNRPFPLLKLVMEWVLISVFPLFAIFFYCEGICRGYLCSFFRYVCNGENVF